MYCSKRIGSRIELLRHGMSDVTQNKTKEMSTLIWRWSLPLSTVFPSCNVAQFDLLVVYSRPVGRL